MPNLKELAVNFDEMLKTAAEKAPELESFPGAKCNDYHRFYFLNDKGEPTPEKVEEFRGFIISNYAGMTDRHVKGLARREVSPRHWHIVLMCI